MCCDRTCGLHCRACVCNSRGMLVYVAFFGEYDAPYPIGVYDTLARAMQACIDSKPTYNTDICVYDIGTGKLTTIFDYDVQTETFLENNNVI